MPPSAPSRGSPPPRPTERQGDRAPAPPLADETVWRVPVTDDDPVRGPGDALVTIVVFSDFECPFCKRAAATLHALQEQYPDRVRLVWKDFPLPSHAQADFAAHFARAVRAQKGDAAFWAAHDRLFERQPEFDNDSLFQIAHAIGGLRWAAIRGDIREQRHGREIYEDLKLAERLDVTKTPTLFVNGRKVVGAVPLVDLEGLVSEELDKAEAKIAAGTPPARLYETLIASGHEVEANSDLDVPE